MPKEIRITNVPDQLREDLENIANNHGAEVGPFLKIKLKELSDSYPIEMKKRKKKN